jgi:hypothetical protein
MLISQAQIKDIGLLDRQFFVMFSFPKVFTSLHQIDDSEVSEEVKIELTIVLREVLRQFMEEDERSAQRNGFVNWGAIPLATGWRQLKPADMMRAESGDIMVKPTNRNHYGKMLYEYGPLKMGVLRYIAQGPYGRGAQNRYHLALEQMLDSMSRTILDKVPNDEYNAYFYTPSDAFGITQDGKEIVAIMKALYKEVP